MAERTPYEVKRKEYAAAMCTRAMERTVLPKQARKAQQKQRAVQFGSRQEHAKSTLLKELFVGEEFTEDRSTWKEE